MYNCISKCAASIPATALSRNFMKRTLISADFAFYFHWEPKLRSIKNEKMLIFNENVHINVIWHQMFIENI